MLLLALSLSAPVFADGARTLVDPRHAGAYECVCSDKKCGSSLGHKVKIALDAADPFLSIDYGDEVHSGVPARTVFSASGAVEYMLATRGSIAFDPKGVLVFASPALWTCEKR